MDKPEKTDDGRTLQKGRDALGSRRWLNSMYDIEKPAKGKRPF